jgi:hypothetical protein
MDDLRGNENRARQEKAGVHNRMTPANAVPPTAADASGVVGRPMGPSIRGDQPIFSDPHRNLRNSAFNLSVKPGEKSRAAEAAETRRRLTEPSSTKYR